MVNRQFLLPATLIIFFFLFQIPFVWSSQSTLSEWSQISRFRSFIIYFDILVLVSGVYSFFRFKNTEKGNKTINIAFYLFGIVWSALILFKFSNTFSYLILYMSLIILLFFYLLFKQFSSPQQSKQT